MVAAQASQSKQCLQCDALFQTTWVVVQTLTDGDLGQ